MRLGSLPPSYRRVQVDERTVAFESETSHTIIHATGRCEAGLDIPLPALRNHLLFGFTEREVLREEIIPYADREALITEAHGKLDGVPRSLLFLVLKKDGCVFDLGLLAASNTELENERAAFDAFQRQASFEVRRLTPGEAR